MLPMPLLALALIALLPALPAAAQDRHQACLEEAASQPTQALERAQAWRQQGGGAAARHCAAAALAELQRYGEAALELEGVARLVENDARPGLLAEAAWLHLLGGDRDAADTALSEAIEQAPNNADLRIDRAIVRAEGERWWQAIDDLDRAWELAPQRTETLLLRAEAYRRVDAAELALDDLNRLLSLEPDNAEALMQRGIVQVELGESEAAAADWRQASDLDPQGEAGRIARENLQRLEAAAD
ncbi:tetratricopeptide repeat protein [Aquibaculum sediminis]|uniref:tetratricopeptide repeat protein n=1 Tax=Aquibaculum sediminis TaxID=3231907 RepID=UPI003452FC94